MVASWTFILKEAGSNRLEYLNSFIDIFAIFYTSRVKAPGSGWGRWGGGDITVRQFALASAFIINLCLEDSNQDPQNGKHINEKI